MAWWQSLLLAGGVLLGVYAAVIAALIVLGRREDARALAGLVPDCVRLVRRLLADARVSRWRKLLLVVLIGYLLSPLDLVPDVIPVAGQLDDAIIVVLALRMILRGGGPDLLAEHWSGPAVSLRALNRLIHGRTGSTAT